MKEGWKVSKLQEVCEKITDGTHQTPKYFEEGVIFLSSKNIKNGKLDWNNVKFIDQAQHIQMHKRVAPKVGDILLAKNGTTGVAAMVDKDVVFDIYVSLAHIRSLGEIVPNYMLHYINSPLAKRQFNSRLKGIGVPNLHLKEIREVNITYPTSHHEQQRIVQILDHAFEKIDRAIANIEQNIKNAEELFNSRKNKIFYQLSENFEVFSLEKVCEKIFAGGDKPKEKFSSTKTSEFDIPIIANAVKDNGLYGYTNEARVTKPSITIAARGSGTGHTEYRDYPFFPIVRLIVLSPNTEKIDVEFLMHAIKSLNILRSGSAIPQLTVPMIKGYSIPLPDLTSQKKVVATLNNLEYQIINYKMKLKEKLLMFSDLKTSLLEKAFKGELIKEVAEL